MDPQVDNQAIYTTEAPVSTPDQVALPSMDCLLVTTPAAPAAAAPADTSSVSWADTPMPVESSSVEAAKAELEAAIQGAPPADHDKVASLVELITSVEKWVKLSREGHGHDLSKEDLGKIVALCPELLVVANAYLGMNRFATKQDELQKQYETGLTILEGFHPSLVSEEISVLFGHRWKKAGFARPFPVNTDPRKFLEGLEVELHKAKTAAAKAASRDKSNPVDVATKLSNLTEVTTLMASAPKVVAAAPKGVAAAPKGVTAASKGVTAASAAPATREAVADDDERLPELIEMRKNARELAKTDKVVGDKAFAAFREACAGRGIVYIDGKWYEAGDATGNQGGSKPRNSSSGTGQKHEPKKDGDRRGKKGANQSSILGSYCSK